MMMLQRPSAQVTCAGGTPPAAVPRTPRMRQTCQLTLAPEPAAVSQGRHAVRETLHAWNLDALADTVVLLASELLTNAVEATSSAAPGTQLTFSLQRTGSEVLVEVWDPNPGQAIQQHPGLTDESGRGLLLVEALSTAWGQRAAGRGKVVWCEITVP